MSETAGEAVQRVLLQRHVKTIIAEIHDADTAAAGDLLDVGDKKVASLDGVPLGKVERRAAVPSAKVVDRPALLAWVVEAHAEWLQPAVDVEPLKAALAEAHHWPAATTVESVRLVIHAAEQHLLDLQRLPATRLREGVEAALLDNVKANGGQHVDPKTGECEDVPGVQYAPGKPTAVVTIDRKNGAPEAVRALLGQSGGMPALTAGAE